MTIRPDQIIGPIGKTSNQLHTRHALENVLWSTRYVQNAYFHLNTKADISITALHLTVMFMMSSGKNQYLGAILISVYMMDIMRNFNIVHGTV